MPYTPVATNIDVDYTAAANTMQYMDTLATAPTWKDYTNESEITEYIYEQDIKEVYSNVELIGLYSIWVHPTTGQVAVFDSTKHTVTYKAADATELSAIMSSLGINATSVAGQYTVQYGTTATATVVNSLEAALLEAAKQYDAIEATDTTKGYVDANDGTTVIDKDAYNKLNTYKTYRKNYIVTQPNPTGSTPATSNIIVTPYNNDAWNEWSEWTFNSNMDGTVAVEPYKVTTSVVSNRLNVTKTVAPTIYAYDFLYVNPEVTATAGAIAGEWNDTTNTAATRELDTAALIGQADIEVETGRGLAGRGIRNDVILDWENFLEELSIQVGGYYYSIDKLDDFKAMYTDRFYSDPVYDAWTGFIDHYEDVDLYNINGLLEDIWKLRTSTAYEDANTSQLIYLMQQYDKYIGDYIDQTEVSTTEWGDLLVSLLNAASADDFKNAIDYKKYSAKVAELTANYENALTAAQVTAAEDNMYKLLTNASAPFYAAATADKTELKATLESLYFNVGTAPVQYSVAPSNPGSNVKYSNYNYYVAALSGELKYDTANDNITFTSKLEKGYYSLYPMKDYIDYDTTTPNEVYAGNTTAANDTYRGELATEEYEWFWNVYQLAANMNKSNKYQGSVDAVNAALSDAVANLSVKTSPNAIELGAVEDALDEYAGKIESDYDAGYYAKYVQANDYAENIAEGKWQTRIAAMIAGVAGEALTYQGTQVTVTKNDMKTVETAIKNGKTALEAIKADKNYNAAQVTALNKAIDNAQYLVDLYEGTYSKYATQQSVNKQPTTYVGDKDQMVKSDLTKAIEAIDAAINYSEIIMGWSKNDAGKWMYGTEEGYLNDGWHQVDGGKTWFYFNADGTAKQSEWWNDNGTWYWFNSNCGAATGWAKVDGEWYFFKGNNAMKTGWEKVDGNWYYMASSGKMVTGWCEVNGKWYYFSKESNSLGQMLYSTTVDGYKLGADGAWVK